MKKILYGICGIGNGHTFRQLPILTTYAERGDRIVIFAYGSSYHFYQKFAQSYPNVFLEQVAVPYYLGNHIGLDFVASEHISQNQENFFKINCHAMAQATKLLGQPDLVISDYEPICAQYAYSYDAPLITYDQQSKYLLETFPEPLMGLSYRDEVMRLRMFFPKAAKRLACSFFAVPSHQTSCQENVMICPPMLRHNVQLIHNQPHDERLTLLVYFSEQHFKDQTFNDSLLALNSVTEAYYHIFLPKSQKNLPENSERITFHHHGDPKFDQLLTSCHGIVATAGHTLLAEAMYLGIPVYAMPLSIYEQAMNAYMINTHHFGFSSPTLDPESLRHFIKNLSCYRQNISEDKNILLRTTDLNEIIRLFDAA